MRDAGPVRGVGRLQGQRSDGTRGCRDGQRHEHGRAVGAAVVAESVHRGHLGTFADKNGRERV
jgi:hypothetical protein